jgi:hypothetical protein
MSMGLGEVVGVEHVKGESIKQSNQLVQHLSKVL